MQRQRPDRCTQCAERGKSRFETQFEMAFQPIIDMRQGTIFAHEALIRGPNGEGAGSVLSQVTEANRYGFDQACRVKAIEAAVRNGIDTSLSINFMPNAVYEPRNCIQATLWAADKYDFPLERIIFEFTEGEEISNLDHVKRIVDCYKAEGFMTAIDDFGAGHAGLGLLADLQPDIIKLDMQLIRGIDTDSVRQKILAGVMQITNSLGITVIAEGIETFGEALVLRDGGIDLMQGFFFARPRFDGLVDMAEMTPVCQAAA